MVRKSKGLCALLLLAALGLLLCFGSAPASSQSLRTVRALPSEGIPGSTYSQVPQSAESGHSPPEVFRLGMDQPRRLEITSTNYVLFDYVVANGGTGATDLESANYEMHGTLGQPADTPTVISGHFALYPGFWGPDGAAREHLVYLPFTARAYSTGLCEPNDSPAEAYGPLVSGVAQPSYPDDTEDWFYVEAATAGNLTAVVTNYSAEGNLLVYAEGDYAYPIAQWGQGGSTMTAGPVGVDPGRYYVRVYTAGDFGTTQLYELVVTYP